MVIYIFSLSPYLFIYIELLLWYYLIRGIPDRLFLYYLARDLMDLQGSWIVLSMLRLSMIGLSELRKFIVVVLFSYSVSNIPVDLVPIPLRGNKFNMGMDWLIPNGAMIDSEQHLDRVRNSSREELLIQGERPQCGPIMCYAVRARRYLHQGCSGFVAYVMDAQYKGKTTTDDVIIVRDYSDVFLEYLPGVPLERQVEFRIDLVPGAAPIAKAPYQLAPTEMQELSTQLQELLDKGFIRPISSPWGSPILFVKKKDGSH